ncbi:MAG: alpha/beta fold hydrolase [Actinomycetota bacterium]
MPQANVNGTTVSYTDSGGEGTPVLLLHAFPMNSGMWEPQIDALGDRFRLIAPDLLGFGGSDAPEDRSRYSMDAYADQLAGLLDELGVDRVVLTGLSMGGYIGFSFLRRHGQRVSALVLADTRAEADPPEGIEKRTGQQKQVESEGTGGLIEALPGALLGATTRETKLDVVDRARKLMDNPPAGFVGALEAIKNRVDSSDDAAKVDVPTLVIVGEEDGITPPEAARRLHELIGGSKLVVIPEAGHLSNIEAPEAFNGALAEFLNSL